MGEADDIMMKKSLVIIMVLIPFMLLVGCISNTDTYTGTLEYGGYPPVSEEVPMCQVLKFRTVHNEVYYLTEDYNFICGLTVDDASFSIGDTVEIIGNEHWTGGVIEGELFQCLEIQSIVKV